MRLPHAPIMGSVPRETHPQYDPCLDGYDIGPVPVVLYLLRRHSPPPLDPTAQDTKVL